MVTVSRHHISPKWQKSDTEVRKGGVRGFFGRLNPFRDGSNKKLKNGETAVVESSLSPDQANAVLETYFNNRDIDFTINVNTGRLVSDWFHGPCILKSVIRNLAERVGVKSGFLTNILNGVLALENALKGKPGIFCCMLLLFSVGIAGLVHAVDNDFITVVEVKDLDNYWLEKRQVRPTHEISKRTKGGCVSIGFIIAPDGKTSNHHIVASFPDNAQDNVWIDVSRRTRYTPAKDNVNKPPVYTVVTRGAFRPSKKLNEEERALIGEIFAICKKKTDAYMTQLVQKPAPSQLTE